MNTSMRESSNRQMGEYHHSNNTSQVNLQPDQTITTIDRQNTARITSERDKEYQEHQKMLSKARMQNAYPSQSMNASRDLTPHQTALGSIAPSAESSVTYLEKMLVREGRTSSQPTIVDKTANASLHFTLQGRVEESRNESETAKHSADSETRPHQEESTGFLACTLK